MPDFSAFGKPKFPLVPQLQPRHALVFEALLRGGCQFHGSQCKTNPAPGSQAWAEEKRQCSGELTRPRDDHGPDEVRATGLADGVAAAHGGRVAKRSFDDKGVARLEPGNEARKHPDCGCRAGAGVTDPGHNSGSYFISERG